MSSGDTFIVEREFGLSYGDFFRIFPRKWPETERLGDRLVRLTYADGRWLQIELSEDKVRKLAALRIPYLMFKFEFDGWKEQQRAEFFEEFELAFQKGGG